MSIRSRLGAVRREVLCSLYRRIVPLTNREPVVSFTFDDFPRTALSEGGAMLARFGARGTFYAAYGLMNTCDGLGDQFRAGDLERLLEQGHELASQTYSHASARAVSCSAFCEDVEKGRQAITKVVGTEFAGLGSSNFAYPFGHVTVRTKRALASRLTSARSIYSGFNDFETDLNLLRANRLYGTLDAADAAKRLIAENVERRSWLIFYTHDVRAIPSPYGCTPELFEAAVACAANSGCRILTVNDVLTEAGVQNGNSKGQVRECVLA